MSDEPNQEPAPDDSTKGEYSESINALLAFLENNEDAETILKPYLTQAPLPHSIEVGAAAAASGLPRHRAVAILKHGLPTTHLGLFKTGRRTLKSRFIWYRAERAAVEAYYEQKRKEAAPLVQSTSPALKQVGTIKHLFALRPDAPITLELPASLTTAEAQRLAEFIRILPFQ